MPKFTNPLVGRKKTERQLGAASLFLIHGNFQNSRGKDEQPPGKLLPRKFLSQQKQCDLLTEYVEDTRSMQLVNNCIHYF